MGRPGKEQVFFLSSLALTGLLGALLYTASLKMPAIPRGKRPDPALLERKDVARAPRGALSDASWTRAGREAFREPRDWLPLPPADLERPPLREPEYVPPPPRPCAGLDRLGLYRIQGRVTPHAFPEEAAPAQEEPAEEAPASAARAASASSPGGAGPRDGRPAAAAPAAAQATTAAPVADGSEFKRRFDWLEVVADPRPWFGIIGNPDKFDLEQRPAEKVRFQRVDPKTGRIMGQASLERDRIKPGGIHFADTAANRTELLLRRHPQSEWSAGRLPALLDVMQEVLSLGREDPVAWRRAAEHLEKYVALDPHHARTYELLADARAYLLDFEGELAALKAAEGAGVEDPGLVVRRARWLARAGARSGALQRLAAGVARFPADRELHLAYGRALLEEGAPESVERALRQLEAAEQGSDSTEERMEVIAESGAALLERGDAERALQEAKRILNVDKSSLPGLRLKGAAEFALGHFPDAEADWQKLLSAAPAPVEEGEAALSLGIARTRLGEFDQARADVRRATELDPRLGAAAAAAEADLLDVTDHLEAAVARCRDAAARAPEDAHLRYLLGRLLRRSGDREGAQAELRRALDLGATFPDLFAELGYLALLDGRGDDARRWFEESLSREERDATRLFLAHACLLTSDLGRARSLFEALQARKPSGEALLGLAWCAYKRGESPVAQQLWVQVKDDLRSAHPDDKAYAAKWLAAVLDLESKQVWEDSIQWREVGNGWDPDARFDLSTRIQPGSFRIAGVQRAGTSVEQWTALKRDVELQLFHEFEVDVSWGPKHQGRLGFGLAHFMGAAAGQQAPQVRASLLLALEPDGSLLLQHREHVDDAAWTRVGQIAAKAGETVKLALRRKERGSSMFQFLANGAPVGEPVDMNPWRGKSKQQVAALFFAAAPGGRECDAALEHARHVQFLGGL